MKIMMDIIGSFLARYGTKAVASTAISSMMTTAKQVAPNLIAQAIGRQVVKAVSRKRKK